MLIATLGLPWSALVCHNLLALLLLAWPHCIPLLALLLLANYRVVDLVI